jgi:hypothetical protein
MANIESWEKAEGKLWEKLDKLTERVTSIEIKLAGLNARMTIIFVVVGAGTQALFKYLL